MSKKLCFIVPTLAMGGMERVVSLLSNYAVETGHDVYIICLMKNITAYEIDDRVNVLNPSFDYHGGAVHKLKVLHYLIRSLKVIKPDVVLAFSEVFNPISILAARLAKTTIYITDRSSPTVKLRLSVTLLRKLTYPLAKGMISQTEAAKNIALQKGYNRNITVIPNPLRPIDDSLNRENKKIIISVGRLIPTKNFKELIDIFYETNPDETWKLWILGDGPDKHILQNQISHLELNDRVTLFGAVKNVDAYLSKASIFAFTSTSEGFPNVLSEALAFPLPCIAYDCPAGPADLILHGENGFLIPLHDKSEFKEKLKQLMLDQTLRRKLVIDYQKHRDKFYLNNIAQQYIYFLLS